MTQAICPISGREEQHMLPTQTGGSGNGSIPTTPSISNSGDENSPLAAAVEAYLLQLCIDSLLNVTGQCNVFLSPLREQRAHVTLDSFGNGGVL